MLDEEFPKRSGLRFWVRALGKTRTKTRINPHINPHIPHPTTNDQTHQQQYINKTKQARASARASMAPTCLRCTTRTRSTTSPSQSWGPASRRSSCRRFTRRSGPTRWRGRGPTTRFVLCVLLSHTHTPLSPSAQLAIQKHTTNTQQNQQQNRPHNNNNKTNSIKANNNNQNHNNQNHNIKTTTHNSTARACRRPTCGSTRWRFGRSKPPTFPSAQSTRRRGTWWRAARGSPSGENL